MTEPRMVSLKEALELNKQDIEVQVDIRKKLMSQMVGNLYTRIIYDEIIKLEDHLRSLSVFKDNQDIEE